MIRQIIFEAGEHRLKPLEAHDAFEYKDALADDDEQEFWFERKRPEGLTRFFSIWRFFRITETSARVLWRLASAVGRGRVNRMQGIVTSLAPREYERYTGRNAAEGLDLVYLECASAEDVRVAIERFGVYRQANLPGMIASCRRALGRIVRDDYASRLEALMGDTELLERVVSGDRSAIQILDDYVRTRDFDWPLFRVGGETPTDRERDYCGIASVKTLREQGLIADTSDAFASYNIGGWWFDNHDVLDEALIEVQHLIDTANAAS